MTSVDAAIEAFGNSLGIPRLAFNEAGVLRLAFETSGKLSIERVEGAVLVFLARHVEPAQGDILERALDLCHFRHAERLRPKVGLGRDEELVFWVRISEVTVDVVSIEEALTLLLELHDLTAKAR
jgi:type III secretion system chaperone SycN